MAETTPFVQNTEKVQQDFLFSLKCAPALTQTAVVSRPRLVDFLSVAVQRTMTLVSAPAGSGKSTLLRSWYFASLDSKKSIAWVSLDAGDNDPSRFWSAIIAAFQTCFSGLGAQALLALQEPHSSSLEGIVASLLHDLASLPSPMVLILDDYHVIEAQHIHQAMIFLLNHLPPQMHLLIATRADPPFPLARWRAQGQLGELRSKELSFTTEEAIHLFQLMRTCPLSIDEIAILMCRTEGWITGLQLAGLSLQGQKDVRSFLVAFNGSSGSVFDYLVEEVFSRQLGQTQHFLLITSLLDRFTGSLCDVLLECQESQSMLQNLERANLFLIPFDNEHRWYRYHPLFTEFLRARLSLMNHEQLPSLHLKAARWFEHHGFIDDAMHHFLASPNFPEAARVLERSCEQLMKSGELTTLLRWLQALPDEQIQSRPYLSMYYAGVLLSTEQLDAAERHLQNAEQAIQAMVKQQPSNTVKDLSHGVSPEMQNLLDAFVVTRASLAGFRGDVAQTLEFSRQAHEHLTKGNVYLESVLTLSLGMAYVRDGDLTRASSAFLAAEEIGHAAHHHHLSLASACAQAYLLIEQGYLHQAAERYRRVLRLSLDEGQQPVTLSSAYLGLGELHYYWNEMDLAERSLLRGLHIGRDWEPMTALTRGSLFLARIQHARGETEKAFEGIQHLEDQALHRRLQHMLPHIGAIRATLWLAQGDVGDASRWAQGSGLHVDDELTYLNEFPYLVLSQVLASIGKLDDAAQLLQRLLSRAETEIRTRSIIDILTRQACVYQQQGNRYRAQQTLLRALLLSEPEGWIRVFVERGTSMSTLLSMISAKQIKSMPLPSRQYLNTLLSTMDQEEKTYLSSPRPLPQGRDITFDGLLTARERDVLHLLALGLSNQQIARELVVAVSTVKWHLKQISAKLAVHNRTEMVAHARELHLL